MSDLHDRITVVQERVDTVVQVIEADLVELGVIWVVDLVLRLRHLVDHIVRHRSHRHEVVGGLVEQRLVVRSLGVKRHSVVHITHLSVDRVGVQQVNATLVLVEGIVSHVDDVLGVTVAREPSQVHLLAKTDWSNDVAEVPLL